MVGISFNHAEEYLHGNCHHSIRPRTEVVNELVQCGEECSVVSSWSPSQEIPETCLAPWERKPAVSGQMKTPSLLRTGCSLPSIPTCSQEEARHSRGSYSYQLWFTRPHMLTSPAHIAPPWEQGHPLKKELTLSISGFPPHRTYGTERKFI